MENGLNISRPERLGFVLPIIELYNNQSFLVTIFFPISYYLRDKSNSIKTNILD